MLTAGDCQYEGSWVNDSRDGKGKYIDPEGTYTGLWKDDKRHGNGIFVSRENQVFKGRWENDVKVDGEFSIDDRLGKSKVEKIKTGKLRREDISSHSSIDLPPVRIFM